MSFFFALFLILIFLKKFRLILAIFNLKTYQKIIKLLSNNYQVYLSTLYHKIRLKTTKIEK